MCEDDDAEPAEGCLEIRYDRGSDATGLRPGVSLAAPGSSTSGNRLMDVLIIVVDLMMGHRHFCC